MISLWRTSYHSFKLESSLTLDRPYQPVALEAPEQTYSSIAWISDPQLRGNADWYRAVNQWVPGRTKQNCCLSCDPSEKLILRPPPFPGHGNIIYSFSFQIFCTGKKNFSYIAALLIDLNGKRSATMKMLGITGLDKLGGSHFGR